MMVCTDTVYFSFQPEVNRKEDGSDATRHVVSFEKTPVMSTYLVAIVVGEFDYVEQKIEGGITIRVFTPVGKKEQGRFALDVAAKTLPYYSNYFQIPYPLPKLDCIAIADFSAGAMENWGLVTYREILLLVDPVNTSNLLKQRVAEVIAHEFAHQWFGNIVTMEWWTHLWLNEGYANFSQALCADIIFPEYEIWTQYLANSFIPALNLDSLKNTHPVEVPVGAPEEVEEIFDAISYDKGSSVIRMLHRYLGDADFRKGMNLYLTRHKYSNTFTEDLWNALGEASGKPVEKVMATWTRLPGFPMVSAEATTDDEKTILTLSQTRFFLNGEKDESGTLWVVPIAISVSMDSEIRTILLDSASVTVTLPKLKEGDWIKVNAGACGFFRTRYTEDLLRRLVPAIQSKKLGPIDRLNVVDDLLSMVKAGYSSTVQLLKLLEAYKDEDNYSVFVSLATSLSTVSKLISQKDMKPLISPLVRDVFANIYKQLGWIPADGESHLDKVLRPLVLSMLGEHEEETVIKRAQSDFADHIAKKRLLPADLQSCVYTIVMKRGKQETFDEFVKLYKATDSHEEHNRISRAMGSANTPELRDQVIDFAMKEVRPQDTVFVLCAMSASSAMGARKIWTYFKDNYDKFVEMYGGSMLMIRISKASSENFASVEDANEVEAFFKKLSNYAGKRAVAQSIEGIRLSAAWLDRDCDSIREYLSKRQ